MRNVAIEARSDLVIRHHTLGAVLFQHEAEAPQGGRIAVVRQTIDETSVGALRPRFGIPSAAATSRQRWNAA